MTDGLVQAFHRLHMDQDAFRETYREVNPTYCAFEKSVLTNECQCLLAERFCIAEREGVHCAQTEAHSRCLHWLELLRSHARFALRSDEERRLLPHGKAMRLQVGGMRGVARLLAGREDVAEDVDTRLAALAERYGSLDGVPFSEIMPDLVAYQVRKRARRRR